jgi:hypothetical protein
MSILIIGPEEQEAIRVAIAMARSNPVPWEVMQSIADPTPTSTLRMDQEKQKIVDDVYKQYPSQSLTLGNCRVAFSFEYQPAGLFRHLSVSVQRKRKVPHYEVVKMLALEFGFSSFPPERPFRIWNEEYEKDHFAVNIIEIEP